MTRNAAQKKSARAYQQSHPDATFPAAMRAVAQERVQPPRLPLAAGTVVCNPANGHVAVKAAPSTTAYEWCGFDPVSGSYPLTTAEVAGWRTLWEPGVAGRGGPASGLTYQAGSVKRNAETGHVAIRSGPSLSCGEWFVFDPINGGYYTATSSVVAWSDISI